MPHDHHDWLPKDAILSYEEILRVARVGAADIGFNRFRITGGEPLVRRDVAGFIAALNRVPGVQSISLTTNGTRLADLADDLRKAGVRSVNISLDALDADLYHRITRGRLDEVLASIDAAMAAGFESVKLNAVLLRGVNEDQIDPLLDFAAQRGVALRFIEMMPLSVADDPASLLTIPELMRRLARQDMLTPLPDARLGAGPATYYRLERRGVTVGFIGAMTDAHFCETCNKMRLTADGFIRPCLGNHGEIDLKPALREAGTDQAVREALRRALAEKPLDHMFRENYQPVRIMTAIGG